MVNKKQCDLLLKITVFSLAVLFSGVHYGWQFWTYFLSDLGAFDDACGDDWNWAIGRCSAQHDLFSLLFLVSQACENIVGVVAGVLLDSFGPKITAGCGVAILATSHGILFMSRSKSAIFCCQIFLGSAQNFLIMPFVLTTENLPAHRALTTAIILCAQSTATTVAPLLDFLYHKMEPQMFGLVLGLLDVFVYLPILIGAIVLIPWSIHSAEDRKTKPDISVFFRALCRIEFLIFALWYGVTSIQYAIFNNVLEYQGSASLVKLVGWLTCIQGIYVLAFNWILDITHVSIVLIALSGITIAIDVLYMLNISGLAATAVLYTFVDACWVNAMFVYLTEYFVHDLYGKLAATLNLTSGIVQMSAFFISPGLSQFLLILLVLVLLNVFTVFGMAFMFLRYAYAFGAQHEEHERDVLPSVWSMSSTQWSEMLADISVETSDFISPSESDEYSADFPTAVDASAANTVVRRRWPRTPQSNPKPPSSRSESRSLLTPSAMSADPASRNGNQ
ncbi:MAG: uncharacterized protein KVP18_003162 [Porospora cf. gigantea A]|uniref:uncharacterized protein n=1 Tax=Porospora cf. gigantea A TaxID=2853593 RepID=UPI003559CD43|nr:MAG: hypothetical protein KVP18_003162 [Porospora cf. gigantea A]